MAVTADEEHKEGNAAKKTKLDDSNHAQAQEHIGLQIRWS